MTAYDPALRSVSNNLCLWGLCANPACRRAKACKRDARDCLKRYAPLVPEEARIGVLAMIEGRRDGVSYEVVRADAPGEIAAIESWIALVHAANGNGQFPETVDHRREQSCGA